MNQLQGITPASAVEEHVSDQKSRPLIKSGTSDKVESNTLLSPVKLYTRNACACDNIQKTEENSPQKMQLKQKKPRKKREHWTQEEDAKLLKLIAAKGDYLVSHPHRKWAKLAAALNMGKNGKQCRDRYINHLQPNIKKSGWSREEKEQIEIWVNKDKKSWSDMAKLMTNRTECAIKNIWYSMERTKNREVLKMTKKVDKQPPSARPLLENLASEEQTRRNSKRGNKIEQHIVSFMPHIQDSTLDHNTSSSCFSTSQVQITTTNTLGYSLTPLTQGLNFDTLITRSWWPGSSSCPSHSNHTSLDRSTQL